ncbi:hypothetical protein J2741_001497 [Methanolinea mesophila]|nr:hypothetical protein [Methanolinea mesophila]
MIRDFIVKMTVAVQEVVANPRSRRPVIFMIILWWLQFMLLIGALLCREVRQEGSTHTIRVPGNTPSCTTHHLSFSRDERGDLLFRIGKEPFPTDFFPLREVSVFYS